MPGEQLPGGQLPGGQGRHAAPSPTGSYRPPATAFPSFAAAGSEPAGSPGYAVGEPAAVALNGPTDQAGLRVDLPDWSTPEPSSAARRRSTRPSALRIIWIYPDLLSTYGDRGNLVMLTRRAVLRGLPVEPVGINSDQPVPRHGDVYLLGGGEDLPQILAARRLRGDRGLATAAANGAVIFAVCAGYQLIGEVFGGVQGEPVEGLGLLDIRSGRGQKRGVGEIVADVDPGLRIDRLTGFENHQGVTSLGPAARPLARVVHGVGNGDGTEGAYSGKVLGTYLHGPALVRNPGLADLLLTCAVGNLPPIAPDYEIWTNRLRSERLAAVSA